MIDAFDSALLVEDELRLGLALKLSLKELRIPATLVTSISEAKAVLRNLAEKEWPDLVLLDRRLPDGDGLDLCRHLRSLNFKGTILVLTASGEVGDRVQGLDAGADDYVSKPFSWEELAARLRALGRRHDRGFSALTSNLNGPWQCDETRLRVLGPRGWVTLTPLEFKLVSKLIRAKGTIVSREELLKKVWGFEWLPKTRTVDYFMGRVRKHFEPDPDSPRYFVTVRGAGYCFKIGDNSAKPLLLDLNK